jgi:multisubunit Na+/H+ antiporter MnhC subunit
LYLLAAVLGVVACRSLKLPPMLGYLAVGVLIGPHALALARNADDIRHLGEFGVVFLMFVIGLEFNLPKLRAMRRHVFGLGLFQVGMTIIVVTLGSVFLTVTAPLAVGTMEWRTALALSGAMAMSSTAIVREIDVRATGARFGARQAGHGRSVVPGFGGRPPCSFSFRLSDRRRKSFFQNWRSRRSRRSCWLSCFWWVASV